jgi:cobalt-zinc-cadmium efflux system membrane fusion protein
MTARWKALAALAVAIAALAGCRAAAPPEEPAPAAAAAEVTVSPKALADQTIVVDTAREIERVDHVLAPAVLALDETRTSRIGAIVEGVVVSAGAQVGDRVRAGTTLGLMHSDVVHEVWASYRKAIAERRRQETEASFAQQNEARAERLLAAKAISAQEVARAKVDRTSAEEALDMAKTEVRRAEEALEHLGITNGEDPTGESGEQIPVRTPIAGVVLERLVTEGTAVTVGTGLFVVSDLSRLWAIAEVDEARLSALAVGRPADLTVPAYPGERFPATIAFIADTVNPTTRRVTVRALVLNAAGRLKPQMYASVSLGAGEPRRAVVVPAAAVQDVDSDRVVFIAGEGGRFTRRRVVTAAEENGQVEVKEGLRAGERIAVKGSFLLMSQMSAAAGPGN